MTLHPLMIYGKCLLENFDEFSHIQEHIQQSRKRKEKALISRAFDLTMHLRCDTSDFNELNLSYCPDSPRVGTYPPTYNMHLQTDSIYNGNDFHFRIISSRSGSLGGAALIVFLRLCGRIVKASRRAGGEVWILTSPT